MFDPQAFAGIQDLSAAADGCACACACGGSGGGAGGGAGQVKTAE